MFVATRGSRLAAATTRSPSLNLNRLCTGSPYPVDAGTSMNRAVYAVPKFVKNTTVARVLPASTASTESPSRRRVVDRSFTSFCRFTHPSFDTMTMLSSSMMKSSAVYSTLSSASISVRRLSSFASP